MTDRVEHDAPLLRRRLVVGLAGAQRCCGGLIAVEVLGGEVEVDLVELGAVGQWASSATRTGRRESG